MRYAPPLILAASLLLAGCDQGLAACESHAKSKLRSPSTYRLVSHERSTIDTGSPDDVVNYTIEYDAANASNAPIRTRALCQVVGGQVRSWTER